MSAWKPQCRVFICYRRSDSAAIAVGLAEALGARVGCEVFLDRKDPPPPGTQFPEAIERQIRDSTIVLAVIGPEWLAVDDGRRSRLADPNDWVRREILMAWQYGIRVIPILLEGTQMPRPSDLTPELARLSTSQAIEVSTSRWGSDVRNLTQVIQDHYRNELQGRWGTWPDLAEAAHPWILLKNALKKPRNLLLLIAMVIAALAARLSVVAAPRTWWLIATAAGCYVALVAITFLDLTEAKNLSRRIAGKASANHRPGEGSVRQP